MIDKILKKVLPETVGLSIVLLIVLTVIDYLEKTQLLGAETLLITAIVFILSTLHDVARKWRRIKEEELKDKEPTEEDILKDDEEEE